MNRTKVVSFLLAVVLIAFYPNNVFSKESEKSMVSEGIGRTLQEAIQNARRNAVQESVGYRLRSQTYVNKGKTLYDFVFSVSSGCVIKEKLLEKQLLNNELWRVKLLLKVSESCLSCLKSFFSDPSVQIDFQVNKFDRRKIVVFYRKRSSFDLPRDSRIVQIVTDLLEDELKDKGFKVFLSEELERLRERTMEHLADEEVAIELGRLEKAGSIVLASFSLSEKRTYDGYKLLKGTLVLKAYDPTTGELFATVIESGKTLASPNVKTPVASDGLVMKVVPRAADKLIEKIVKRFCASRERFVEVEFRNVPLKVQDIIEDTLQELWGDGNYKIEEQLRGYMKVSIYVDISPTSVRNILRKEFKKRGIPILPVEFVGTRIVFEYRR